MIATAVVGPLAPGLDATGEAAPFLAAHIKPEPRVVLFKQHAAVHREAGLLIDRTLRGELGHAARPTIIQPGLFAELRPVTAHRDVAGAGRHFKRQPRAFRLIHAAVIELLIDPRAEQRDLVGFEWLALAGRWHGHIAIQSGDRMNQRTIRALTQNNGRPVLTTRQRGRTVVEPEAALRFLRSMTTETGFFKDGEDVLPILDLASEGRRQFVDSQVGGVN